MDNWNRHRAAEHARRQARPLSEVVSGQYKPSLCGVRVREAIEAGGVVLARKASAKDYGASLSQAGFSTDIPVGGPFAMGDVVVLPAISGHVHGHIALFDGKDWISDFIQRDIWGGNAYRQAKPPLSLYRRWPALPPEARNMFTGASAKPASLPAETRLFKFSMFELFPGQISPWWALRNPDVRLGALGYQVQILAATESSSPVDYVRNRFAVMLNWNSLAHPQSGLLRVQFIKLLRPVLGYHGRCAPVLQHRAHSLDPRPDLRYPGGAHQLFLPDLVAGDLIGDGMQMVG